MTNVHHCGSIPQPPEPERPTLDPDYGISTEPEGMLPWSWVDEQLAERRNLWLATARADGRPHAAPVWFVWVDQQLCFSTAPGSVKGRNLARSPWVTAHLESGDEVVVLEGAARLLDRAADAELIASVDRAYHDRYGMTVSDHRGGVLYALRPSKVLAWREQDFPASATRWRFDLAGR
ncbi:MAG TPA: pyridoxamine 5'-phosphate oxidase family protein [Thermoanaerobaculia bacterium]|nr:pyridoxamine 5'-phosphate oxidase family protein [Thermoanaerobaculia bacterium]